MAEPAGTRFPILLPGWMDGRRRTFVRECPVATMVSVSQSWRGPSVAWCRCGRGYEVDFCQDKGNETKASIMLVEDIHLESKDSESAEPSVRGTAPTEKPFSREIQQSGSCLQN